MQCETRSVSRLPRMAVTSRPDDGGFRFRARRLDHRGCAKETRCGRSVCSSSRRGDEITLGFGQTDLYLWDDDPRDLANEVQRILGGVFAGRFEEAGRLRDSFATVIDDNGETIGSGRSASPASMAVQAATRLRAVLTTTTALRLMRTFEDRPPRIPLRRRWFRVSRSSNAGAAMRQPTA